MTRDDEPNEDAQERYEEHLTDRGFYKAGPANYDRGLKSCLAYAVVFACFPLFFLFLFWLHAGAPLP
jgi:hypothetical protein